MLHLVLGCCALFAGLWKSLGSLLWPLLRGWVSRGPTLGFLKLLTIRKTDLRGKALEAVTKALAASLPLQAASVHIDYLTLSLGFIVGARVRATKLKVVLERLPEEKAWAPAEQAICDAQRQQSSKEAQASISLVEKSKNLLKPPGGAAARLVEIIIAGTRIHVDELLVIIQDPDGAEEVSMSMSLDLCTRRSRKIEWRGTHVSLKAGFRAAAGGEELMAPTSVAVNADLPKVLRTLMVPSPLPNKRAIADVRWEGVSLTLQPSSVTALTRVSDTVARFGVWKNELVERERTLARVPLSSLEYDELLKAIQAKQKDLSQWESRMTCKEILDAFHEAEQWPVPENMSLSQWLDKLKDEQKPLRALDAAVELTSLSLELLGASEKPGMGSRVLVEAVQADVALLDVAQEAEQSPDSTARVPPQDDMFSEQKEKMRAVLSIGSLEVHCEPSHVHACKVLSPCSLEVNLVAHSAKQVESLSLKTKLSSKGGDSILATVSSRSVWRLQRAARGLQAAQAEVLQATGITGIKGQSTRSLAGKASKAPTPGEPDTSLKGIKSLFEGFDRDRNGMLDKEELHEFVETLYRTHMTPQEVTVAADQLYRLCGGGEGISFEDMSSLFRRSRDREKDKVCLKLAEMKRFLPMDFDARKAWKALLAADQKASKGHPLTAQILQLHWVRTLQNYREARRFWESELQPLLESRLKCWVLNGAMPAIDLWSDPTFSERTLKAAETPKGLLVNLDLALDGFSVRLADTQHESSVPRAKLDVKDLSLKGGVLRAPGSTGFEPWNQGIEGELEVSAAYWNQSQQIVEPFVEPWRIKLRGDDRMLSLRSEQHMVMNLTPPLIQALTVAANSLAEANEVTAFDKLEESEPKPVAAWIYNRTLCDVRVSVRAEDQRSESVSISRWEFDEPRAVELACITKQRQGTEIESAQQEGRWVLEVEVRGGDTDDGEIRSGGGWWVRQEIDFATSGRRLLQIGQHCMAVDFYVSVHTLAPVVSLCGVCQLRNMTSRRLTVDLGATDAQGRRRTVNVEPYPALNSVWSAGIGGGYEVSMPSEELQEATFTAALPMDSDVLDEKECLLEKVRGYRFVLLEHEGKLRNGEIRNRLVVCVPMLAVMNVLPCEIECSVRRQRKRQLSLVFTSEGELGTTGVEPSKADDEMTSHTQIIKSGGCLGFNDVDPEHAIEVSVKLAGYTYSAIVPAKALRSKRAVMQTARRIKNRASRTSKLEFASFLKLSSDDPSAPRLELDLDWENNGALLSIYSRFWISDKTGWGIEVSSGDVAAAAGVTDSEKVRAVPVPAQGAWASAEQATSEEATSQSFPSSCNEQPQLALLRAQSEQICVRLLDGCSKSLQGWSWDEKAGGGPLEAWWGARRHSDPEIEEAASHQTTGWSSPLSVGQLGSSGAANLPSPGILGSASLTSQPLAEVGVSVAGLPSPFERTKLVTIVPRYVVRNKFSHPIEVWCSRGKSKRAPEPLSHLAGTWQMHGEGEEVITFSLASWTDGLVYSRDDADGTRVHGILKESGKWALGEVSRDGETYATLRLAFDSEKECLVCNLKEGDGDWQGDEYAHSQDARVTLNPTIIPGGSVSLGAMPDPGTWAGSQLLISIRIPERDKEGRETAWSVQIPISAVGDSVLTLRPADGSEPLLVRASVQLEKATFFVLLSRGQWPYAVQNRSDVHTVAIHQEGLDLSAGGAAEEWLLRPCEVRRFVFPDPDLPKVLVGRILGAGMDKTVRYEMDNFSAGGSQKGLTTLGLLGKAGVKASLQANGITRTLVLDDPEAEVSSEDQGLSQEEESAKDQATIMTSLALDIFLQGIHVCVVDTESSVPQELLGFTVDYVQAEKARNSRSMAINVHHMQLDDFGDEDKFIFGPLESGLNSRTSATEVKEGLPMLSVSFEGPTSRSNAMYDAETGALTLKKFELAVRPLEARFDVPRILHIAHRLQGWRTSLDAGQSGSAKVLERVLAPGFKAPKGGDLTCSVGLLNTGNINLNLDIKMVHRSGDTSKAHNGNADDQEDDTADLSTELRKAFGGLGILQPIVEFFARLGASFADASPRFKFGALIISDASAVMPVLLSAVSRHYSAQLLQQSARVLGSLQLLGDPANLVDEVGTGVVSFFSKTKEEVLGRRAGIGSGVSDLAGGVLGGAFGSVAKVSGSLKDTVGSSLGQPIGSDKKADNLVEGVNLGYDCIAVGISEGITGIVKEPFHHANEDGLYGLAAGTAFGAASAVVRPLEGFLGAVEKLAQGAEGEIRGHYRGYGGLRRPPRTGFHKANGLQSLEQCFFWPVWLLQVESVSLPALWHERRVISLAISLRHAGGTHSVNEVRITRGYEADQWCAEDSNRAAVGRVGRLRAPFALVVEALLETNVEMAKPSKVVVATSEIETKVLQNALISADLLMLTMEMQPAPSPALQLTTGMLGKIECSLGPALDPKILPARFIPGRSEEEVEEEIRTGQLGLHMLGPAMMVPQDQAMKAVRMTEDVLGSLTED
eukprot:TRINITY_DN11332_c0_g2_i1.p1 TRINITY_DN11332_c0_g2~~TRINITY_DN11332_c0_g2_i1.p1  ORF type:complete len:2486 (+),score=536.22 TRINITY_DN11332_c0_g2_i1:86-7543(+)